MSKITLEPNDSGAGTFSIVSPDSNTNRTLALPDEAGKLLSTGNNDPAEVFKQSNILGTVSQSGGVPTGAIIERGSNANGKFVKYADGTMICTRRIEMESFPEASASATNRVQFNHTFPVTFIDPPIVSISAGVNQNTSGRAFSLSSYQESTVEWDWRIYPRATVNLLARAYLYAIGRWY